MSESRLPIASTEPALNPRRADEEMKHEEKVEKDPSIDVDKLNHKHHDEGKKRDEIAAIVRELNEQLYLNSRIKLALIFSIFVLVMSYVVMPGFTYAHVSTLNREKEYWLLARHWPNIRFFQN